MMPKKTGKNAEENTVTSFFLSEHSGKRRNEPNL